MGDGGRSGMVRSSLSTASMSKPSPAWASMARRSYGSDHVSTALAWARGLGQHGPGDDLGQLGQDRLQAADHGLEQADAASEGAVYVGLDRAVVVQVDDADCGVGLTDTVDAADPLLDPHRVPRHVVVDHRAAELEVQSLGGGVGAQQDVGLTVAETTLGFVSVNDAPRTVCGRDLSAAPRRNTSDACCHRCPVGHAGSPSCRCNWVNTITCR